MPSPTLANLEGNLRRLKNAERSLFSELWGAGSVGRRGLGPNRYKLSQHTNLVSRLIPNVQRQIANRRRRNAAKRHWGVVRKHVTARGITNWLYKTSMRPSSPGGAGFQRLMRGTGVGKKSSRSVGTYMSPRRSPKRRNMGTSP